MMLWLHLFLFGIGACDLLDEASTQIAELQATIARLEEELSSCREGLQAGRRNQVAAFEKWTVSSGPCNLDVDNCLTSEGFPDPSSLQDDCVVAADFSATRFLHVERLNSWGVDSDGYGAYRHLNTGASWEEYLFEIDGETVSVRYDVNPQLSALQGMAHRDTLAFRPSPQQVGPWKLCHVAAPFPWRVASGSGCQIDTEGCFENAAHVRSRLSHLEWVGCFLREYEECTMEISSDWEGSMEVARFTWPEGCPEGFPGCCPSDDIGPLIQLTVNDQTFRIRSNDDFERAGIDGMVASGTLAWGFQSGCVEDCALVRICPAPRDNFPGPWGDHPWTCTMGGDDCQSNCTQQLSDPDDRDGDGSLHNGHPQCDTFFGRSFCGPCTCSAGEEQTYIVSRVYNHTDALALVSCAPCASGRFKPWGGFGVEDSCPFCPPGFSSLPGATACFDCPAGSFGGYEFSECASCQPGFFSDGAGQTMCQGCAAGRYASAERQTMCAECQDGFAFVREDEACQICPPGTHLNHDLMTACSRCDAGSYQHLAGRSQCDRCSTVSDPDGPNTHLWTTMSRSDLTGKWQEIFGSSSVSDCGCGQGAWVDTHGHCQACGAGILCHGMGEVEVLPGYFAGAESAGFVWKCHGADWARCPGGSPGTCAQHRLNTSTACEECEPFTRMTYDGPCQACSGPDVGLLAGATMVAVFLLVLVYYFTVREAKHKSTKSVTFVSIICTQFVTLFQMLGVLDTLSVPWPGPFARILEMGSLLNFRLEVLSVGCVVTTPPLYRYVGNAFFFAVLTTGMVVIHFVRVLVFHLAELRRAGVRQFMPALLGAVGTIFMAVIISVCSAVVQPLQCDTHPNGRSTMRAYRAVICWDSEDHKHIMIAGVVASLVPLAFFSMCSWVTFSLPKRLQRGDTVFLTTFSFLFCRFRPGAHHYLLFSLLRSVTLAVVPVLEGPASELFTSCAVVTACILISGAMSPWAVHQGNQLDLAIHTGLLFILFLAALHTHQIDEVAVGNLLVAIFCATMCAFLVAVAWLIHLCALRRKKPFQFFLCHHKVGAGAFCRLLKTRLKSAGVARDVFLDSDNLQDLSLLFAIVSEKTETLVVLCSREILHRPWCVGEMTTARLQHIDTILVMFPDFQMPSRTFIEGYAGVEGAQSLAPYGISLEMVQHTLWWLGTRPWIVLPCAISLAGVDAAVGKLISRRGGRDEMATVACMESTTTTPETEESGVEEGGTRWRQPQTVSHQVVEPYKWSTPATVSVVSIVDHSNQESVCTALLVKELLKKFFPLSGAGHVLGPEENVPVDATTLLVMSSNGCFQKPSFIRQLFQIEAPGICAFPIIIDDTFQFPSDALFRELRGLSSYIMSDPPRDPADLIAIIQSLFQEIGIHVRPQDSLAALEVRAATLACRLSAPRATLHSKLQRAEEIHLEVVDDEEEKSSPSCPVTGVCGAKSDSSASDQRVKL